LGLEDFSRQSQDLAAVELIRQRGGLKYIQNDDLDGLMDKLGPEWASIPTRAGTTAAKDGVQHVTSRDKLKTAYANSLAGKPVGDSRTLLAGLSKQSEAKRGGSKSAGGSSGTVTTTLATTVQVAAPSGTIVARGNTPDIDTQTVEERMAAIFGITKDYLA